ncbi:YgfZ/GcvT domain-containing protein [Psychrobacter sanguinis]|uniref:CAF17-like 4Fe-4S cluster assembly/insertion protein YgfZ n=1 Tax=Psychrobacter sanguinis TaxID=861445 RepID=UPI00020C93DD|nr:glycine cleavage system protein T [Psychrobacter sanguinis]EGK14104.1 glycine cleavage T protein [Psychrobacter sp. 1501(2011)]
MPTVSNLTFKQITLQGEDAGKFLQSQLTVNINKIDLSYIPAAIANLKGRIEFGIWVKKQAEDQFDIVISADCLPSLQAHLKKFGAFSKFTTSEPIDIYPCVLGADTDEQEATFSHNVDKCDVEEWKALSIATGNYWIVEATQELFQPQELRLHQRGGVDYDKGCYLGQEVIARIYFKASPKAFLHRVKGEGEVPQPGASFDKVQIVNAIATQDKLGFEALVVARPEHLENSELQLLPLPTALQGDVARDA